MVFTKGHKLGLGRTFGSKNKKTLALLERYEAELDAIVEAMKLKDKNTEDYRTLVDAADKIQKQVQLLNGGATDIIQLTGVDITIQK